jgi:hypothetical protein
MSEVSSQPEQRPGLDWRAIAFGAAAILALGIATSLMLTPLLAKSGTFDTRWLALWPLVGLVADGLGGALAGLLARQRGALHGLLASALAFVGGMVMSIARMVYEGFSEMLLSPMYWVQVIGWSAAGLGVAALAGWLAARTVASESSR